MYTCLQKLSMWTYSGSSIPAFRKLTEDIGFSPASLRIEIKRLCGMIGHTLDRATLIDVVISRRIFVDWLFICRDGCRVIFLSTWDLSDR